MVTYDNCHLLWRRRPAQMRRELVHSEDARALLNVRETREHERKHLCAHPRTQASAKRKRAHPHRQLCLHTYIRMEEELATAISAEHAIDTGARLLHLQQQKSDGRHPSAVYGTRNATRKSYAKE